MEQNFDSPAPIVTEEKKTCSCEGGCKCKKGKKGLTITTIIMTVLGLTGIGFGVYGMVKANEKPEEKEQATETKCDVADKTTENTETGVEEAQPKPAEPAAPANAATAPSNTAPYIKSGYFYVPEWGLKFKIPQELGEIGYSVNYAENGNNGAYSLPAVGFTATLKSDIKTGQDRTYDDIETCAIVNITKESANWNKHGINGIIKKFDGYTLLIWNHSRHGSCEFSEIADRAQVKIQAMFSNPEKI